MGIMPGGWKVSLRINGGVGINREGVGKYNTCILQIAIYED